MIRPRAHRWMACLALIGLQAGVVHAGSPIALSAEVQGQIDFLLARVEDSGYIFIRNGDEHDSIEAARHMRRKYEHFLKQGDIHSVDDFIDLAGTKSLITRKPYKVRLPDGTEVPTAQWLREELSARGSSSLDRT